MTELSAPLAQSALGVKKESAVFAAKLDFQATTAPKALGDTKAMSAPLVLLVLLVLLGESEQLVGKEKLVNQQ